MEMNEVLDRLPKHLMNLVIDQPYNSYTLQDHALWRYVMKQNVRYLPKVVHASYLEGLRQTGISIDEIPHMYGMNRILKKIGWAAVAVDGFIPPSAFMEFQAYNVLVIAADIRPIDQIEYTPAPDIIHEAAGHAPIIADPEYAEYLRLFGEIGSRAFSSSKDYEIYNAIRHLSILKADPYTAASEIENAEKALEELNASQIAQSEMALIRNLHWWTVEYGLIGDLNNPKIYGAGLLSSIGESYSSLQPEVKKIPYTIDAVNYNFDITTKQPQLFVTPDFANLVFVLNEFADRMALRKGGIYGIEKAKESGKTATVVYSSGLQVSGTFSEYLENNGNPIYLKCSGPVALAYNNTQLEGHGIKYHHEGFGSPIGKLNRILTPLEQLTDNDLKRNGIEENKITELKFESGILVKGKLINTIRKNGKIILMTFTDCLVTYEDEVLFDPAWGVYDMAVGAELVSAFSGPADANAFAFTFNPPEEKTHKIEHDTKAVILHKQYQKVREIRNSKNSEEELMSIFNWVKENHPEDWLLPMEILEISVERLDNGFAEKVRDYLKEMKNESSGLNNLIRNGFDMIDEEIKGKPAKA